MASKEFLSVPEFVKSVHYMLGGPGTLDASASWVDENGNSIDYAKKGTVLGKVTATGLLVPYNNSGSGGEQTAIGILWEDVSFGNGGNASAVYMIHGRVDENRLIGLDADAKTDLPHIVFESSKVGAVPLWSALSGTITDAIYSTIVVGAVVTLTLPDGSSISATSDVNGKFKFTDIPHGNLPYSIACSGYVTKTGTFVVGYNEDATINVEIMPVTGTVSGTITHASGNVEGAVVTITGTDGITTFVGVSGSDGTYSIPNVPYGDLTYTVEAEGYVSQSGTITVDDDETLDILLVAAGG